MRLTSHVILILIFLLIIPATLFAGDCVETVSLRFILRDDIRACRYQVNHAVTDGWTLLDQKDPSVEWVSSDILQDIVYYQYTLDGKSWSSSFELSYDPISDTWEHPFSPLEATGITPTEPMRIALGGLYVKPLGNTPQALYEQGYGGSLRFIKPYENMEIYGEASYWKGSSPSDLITTVHTGSAGIGAAYPVDFGILTIAPQIGAGLLFEAPIHCTGTLIPCYDGYGKVGVDLSGMISEHQELFLRGEEIFYTGSDQMAFETAVTVGTSVTL